MSEWFSPDFIATIVETGVAGVALVSEPEFLNKQCDKPEMPACLTCRKYGPAATSATSDKNPLVAEKVNHIGHETSATSETSKNIEVEVFPAPTPRKVTPPLLANYRAARAWIMPRLDQLLAHGWTRRSLFRVGTMHWPYLWGVAWSNSWTASNRTPRLGDGGAIIWSIEEPSRTVTQRMSAPCGPANHETTCDDTRRI